MRAQFADHFARKHRLIRLARRHLNERHRIQLAKALYSIGGCAYKYIKRYSRMYEVDHDAAKNGVWITRPVGRRWMGVHWALVLGIDYAAGIDPGHYDHWAYVHRRCAVKCVTCGGMACTGEGCGWPPEVEVTSPQHLQTADMKFGSRRRRRRGRRNGRQ